MVNQEVLEKLKNRRKTKKVWDTTRDDVCKLAFETSRKEAIREVTKTINKEYEKRKIGKKGWAERIVQDSKAKRQTKQGCIPNGSNQKSANNNEILVEERKVKQRWKEYFEN